MSNLLRRAEAFAEAAHATQKQRYTNEPYIVHCRAVAETLMRFDMPLKVIAAGFLHDTVEDTDVTLDDIEREFGPRARLYVSEVTDVEARAGNRATRKAMDRARLAAASSGGQNIKCADLISNTRSIARYDPKFAKTYLAEKEAVLRVLTKAHPDLLALAWSVLRDGQAMLVQHALKPPGTDGLP